MLQKSFRKRIFISFLLALLPVLILLSTAVELLILPTINDYSKQQLISSTKMLTNMVRSNASVAVKNHLKAIAEQNREIVSHHMNLVEQGLITLDTAEIRLREIILSQRVADSGYLYCIDSNGVAVVHPNKGVENVNFRYIKFIQDQIKRKQGYLEYDWKNPEDSEKRPKALYMVYYEPLDWIISATSYRSEFNSLLNPEDLEKTVFSQQFGKDGYAYIAGTNGQIVVHPKFDRNYNLVENSSQSVEFHLQMVKKKSGVLRYKWMNPGEISQREKIAAFESIPEFGWIVVTTAYMSDINSLTLVLRGTAHGAIILFVIMGSVASYYLSGKLSRPVDTMINQLDRNARKEIHAPLSISGEDEFSRLAIEFNSYLSMVNEQNQKISQERQRYRGLFETSPDGIMLIKHTTIIDCNSAALALFQCQVGELTGKTILDVSPKNQPDGVASAVRVEEKRANDQKGNIKMQCFEWLFQRMDGELFEAEVRLKRLRIKDGEPLLVCFVKDVTEHKKLEAMFLQAQKMEAIGTLAGGLAHDFNNLLTGILGRVELLRMAFSSEEIFIKHLETIEEYVDSASGLTRQLLGFSRGGKYKLGALDVNALVKKNVEMFGRTRKEIKTVTDISSQFLCVQADRQQLEQVLLNLFVNAWQAMDGGGTLQVKTDYEKLDALTCEAHDVKPGVFVKITVKDSGSGMEESIQERIFDPFFTTKELERGTGLGLASVYGIVKNHGGFITVASRINEGARFTVYLPRSQDKAAEQREKKYIEVEKGNGTLLLIDDEQMILDVGEQMIAHLGYHVLCARGGRQGIEMVRGLADSIDLVILDVIMPEFDGYNTFNALRKINPVLPIILASGYSIDDKIRQILQLEKTGFIQKPYLMFDLSTRIKEMLAAS